MNLFSCFYAFMTALAVSLVMVPFLHRWAIDKGGALDLPDERKVHDTPIPRVGGIAIFHAFFFSVLIFAPLSYQLRGLLAGGLIIYATGLVDDLRGLSSRQKFGGQILACLVAIFIGEIWLHDLGNLFGFGRILLPAWLGVPITVFAIVGVTNAINLIDGLDGLAGGVSVLALGVFCYLGLLDGGIFTPLLAAALAGAILGFLKYNFYPARIFMGDTGSLSVGFFIGFLAVNLTQREGAQVSPMVPVLVLGLPLFDAVWVMSRRLLRRRSPFAPDRGHVHHKFLDLGLEHRFTVIIIYAISLIWACSALLLGRLPEYLLLAYLLGSAVCCYLLLRHIVRHPERFHLLLKRDAPSGIRNTTIFQRLATRVDRLSLLLAPLLGLYALLAIYCVQVGGLRLWPVALSLGLIGLGLRLWGQENKDFQLLLVYAAAGLAAFVVWQAGTATVLGEVSAKRLGDLLLLVSGGLFALKMLFRRAGEYFLGSADFLALALLIFLLIAAQLPATAHYQLNGPLVRAILVIFAIRTLAFLGPVQHRLLVHAALILMVTFTVVGLLR